ncbi:hypothetical protein C8R44DRAFT_734270 [Mycena epipterygia]|nr:hypothetical protein C8R44DRAFT_734270 [Mycena epipterygia]
MKIMLGHFGMQWLEANSGNYVQAEQYSEIIDQTEPQSAIIAVLALIFGGKPIIRNWAAPIRNQKNTGGRTIRDNCEIDIPALGGFVEENFSEWGHRSHFLPRAALLDDKERENLIQAGVENPAISVPLQPLPAESVGTPTSLVRASLGFIDSSVGFAAAFVNKGTPDVAVSDTHPLLVKVVNARSHVSTDELLEFRVEVCPQQLVALANSGIEGTRKPPLKSDAVSDQKKKTTPELESNMRMGSRPQFCSRSTPSCVKGKGKALGDESDSDSTGRPDKTAAVQVFRHQVEPRRRNDPLKNGPVQA